MPDPARGARHLPPLRFLVEFALLVGLLATALAATDGGSPAPSTPLSTATSEVPLATASPPAAASTAVDATSATVAPAPVSTTTPTPAPTAEPSPAERAATTPSTAVATPLSPAAPMSASAPLRLQIPSIGVDSELMGLGLRDDGSLEVPPSGFPAGWYRGAPTPGEHGPAIVAGHVDWAGKPGVFYDLRGLTAGDAIAITRDDGSTAQFRVTRVERFAKDAFPTAAVYGDIDHAGLRLITCGGSFDSKARSYRDNLVVFAELVG